MVKRSAETPAPMLDARVRGQFGVSWGRARAYIEQGKVFVDGHPLTDATRRIGATSVVELRPNAPKPRPARLGSEAIAHIDTHVVVVRKPAGLSSVPYLDDEPDNLEQRLRDYLTHLSSRGGVAPLGVVHRLDKETSGLIVFTRTWMAKQSLSAQFRGHTVHRRYIAIAHGQVRAQTFRSHISSDRGDGLRGTSKHKGGQLAITHVEPLKALEGATLVACELETGRTHQIRIHLAEAGHPLLGERVYVRGYRGAPIPASRLMLHAAELGFEHPATHAEMRFVEPLPEDIEATIKRLS